MGKEKHHHHHRKEPKSEEKSAKKSKSIFEYNEDSDNEEIAVKSPKVIEEVIADEGKEVYNISSDDELEFEQNGQATMDFVDKIEHVALLIETYKNIISSDLPDKLIQEEMAKKIAEYIQKI